MFCPKCGKGEQTANAYCRNCGDWLPDVSKSIQLAFGGNTPKEHITSTIIFNALSAIFAAFITFVIYSLIFTGTRSWQLSLAGSFALCILGWQITSILISLKLWRRVIHNRKIANASAQLNAGSSEAKSLPAVDTSRVIRPISVTEKTTDLLEAVPRKSTK